MSDSADAPPLGGLRALVAAAEALATARRDGVLCVVTATSGSTYRKPGALILLDAGGVRVGALSGGCLESELEAHARDVLAEGVARAARFDTSGDEDRVFGSGTGCGGSVDVVLLPLPAGSAPLRRALRAAESLDVPMTLRLEVDGDGAGRGEALAGEERHRFDERGLAPDDDDAKDTSGAVPCELTVQPSPRLLLVGAGPETLPLLALTRRLGWRTHLLEHRERWLRFAEHAGADMEHRGGPDEWPAVMAGARFAAALVMSHNFDLDARALRALSATDVPYVGLLGPASRRDELLAEIGADAPRIRPRLRAPVGLRLGGEGAEAIALSIIAQLQQELTGGGLRS